jgi:hypothetical protein
MRTYQRYQRDINIFLKEGLNISVWPPRLAMIFAAAACHALPRFLVEFPRGCRKMIANLAGAVLP